MSDSFVYINSCHCPLFPLFLYTSYSILLLSAVYTTLLPHCLYSFFCFRLGFLCSTPLYSTLYTTLSTTTDKMAAIDSTPLSASSMERRNSLEKHLQMRPEAQDLRNRHILQGEEVAPYVSYCPSPSILCRKKHTSHYIRCGADEMTV